MAISTKWASQPFAHASRIPAGEIALARYTAGILCLAVIHTTTGASLFGRNRIGLLWRGVSGGVASTAYFVGIQSTSLTHATLLNNTTIIWGSLFAVFWLGEKLRRPAIAGIIIAFIGVVLVTAPGAITIQGGDLISLFSGFVAGLAIVQIRKLRRTESAPAIFFYLNLVGLPTAGALLIASHTALVAPSPLQLLALLLVGITSVSAQLLMTYGYKTVPTAQGSLITLTAILFTTVLSNLIFNEHVGIHTLIGGLSIIAGAAALSIWPPRSSTQ